MKQRIQNRWDTGSILRLLLVLGSVALYLSATQWAEHLDFAFILVIVGGILGAFVGTSNFTYWEGTGIAYVVGTLLIFTLGSSSLNTPPTETNRGLILVLNLGNGITELFHQQPVSSSLPFLIIMMIFSWYLGYFGAYGLIRRKQPWAMIGLAGVGIVLIEIFLTPSKQKGILSALFFFFLLMLITRVFFSRLKDTWAGENIHYDSETRFDLNGLVILTSVFIILAAWTVPNAIRAFTPGTAEQIKFHIYIDKWTKRWNNLFASLNSSDNSTVFSFEDLLSIGTTIPRSEEIVFTVQAEIPPPEGIHYYWRARSYDFYDGMRWSNSQKSQELYLAGNEFTIATDYEDAKRIQFNFHTHIRTNAFFQGGLPGSIDQPGLEIFNPAGNDGKDIIALQSANPLAEDTSYSTIGWMITPTISEMRNSPMIYPQWVINTYLSIPSTMPDRVKELADLITKDKNDPYSKTEEITKFLRRNMHYSGSISTIPTGRDFVDWFLFDSREGFCLQYATAEIILLRSIGIPARLVAGYSQGVVSHDDKTFNVRLKDGHAWPEVYFANIGWVVFEPTVIISQQSFLAGEEAIELGTPTIQPTKTEIFPLDGSTTLVAEGEQGDVAGRTFPLKGYWFFGLILLIIFSGAVAIIYVYYSQRRTNKTLTLPERLDEWIRSSGKKPPRWIRKWANATQTHTIEKHFRIIKSGLKRLRITVQSSETPQEQGRKLIGIIPESTKPIKNLLREYEKAIYGGHKPNLKLSGKSSRQIRRMILKEQLRQFFNEK
jgi:transglutaminase-like putative cysteine protease